MSSIFALSSSPPQEGWRRANRLALLLSRWGWAGATARSGRHCLPFATPVNPYTTCLNFTAVTSTYCTIACRITFARHAHHVHYHHRTHAFIYTAPFTVQWGSFDFCSFAPVWIPTACHCILPLRCLYYHYCYLCTFPLPSACSITVYHNARA